MNPLYRNDIPGQFPPSYYAATADIPTERPALRGDQTADVVILGAGFCGLWAAKTLSAAGLKTIILEAHRTGFGASGRNGGQAGALYNMDMMALERAVGDNKARALFDIAEDGLTQLIDFCEEQAPEAAFKPGIAHGAWTAQEFRELREYAEHMEAKYDFPSEVSEGDDFRNIVKSPKYSGGVIEPRSGHLHPLRYCLALARAAEAAGTVIYERSEVTGIHPGKSVVFETDKGRVTARHGLLAGNGYLPASLSRRVARKTMPINSFIAATEPLGDRADTILSRDIAVADERFVVNYFRLSEDKRLLFGGRENYTLGFPKDIGTRLVERMEILFPQLKGVSVDYTWGGTLGITPYRVPALLSIGENTYSAGGFSGHGVSLAGMAGRVIAEAILGQEERFDVMSELPNPGFPGGATFRPPILALAMTWYSLRDRLGV